MVVQNKARDSKTRPVTKVVTKVLTHHGRKRDLGAPILTTSSRKKGYNQYGCHSSYGIGPCTDIPRISVFQQIDVEVASDMRSGGVILRMFGVTEVCFLSSYLTILELRVQAGHSVLAHITDFLPYFYVPLPRGFTHDDLHSFADHLNVESFPV
jgi:hypothetical protein